MPARAEYRVKRQATFEELAEIMERAERDETLTALDEAHLMVNVMKKIAWHYAAAAEGQRGVEERAAVERAMSAWTNMLLRRVPFEIGLPEMGR